MARPADELEAVLAQRAAFAAASKNKTQKAIGGAPVSSFRNGHYPGKIAAHTKGKYLLRICKI